ncbi:ABC transporter permease [Tannerella sp.]|uniref:ABC transporter permease n=1 Tax=Tannerella sp. TaxID=2382127 RepID=UPI0026DCD7C8|nr:ABC transporter permease [Tannerella sp.]MDO4704290.1 ABC transporter permease [Tannerella sp.]
MNSIGLIIKREYIRRVRKKSFVLLTFLTPLLMIALIFVPLWLSSIKSSEIFQVSVIDETGKYVSLFKDVDNYRFFDGKASVPASQDEVKEVFATLKITDDLLEHPEAAALYSHKQIPEALSRTVNETLRKQIESDKIASYQIPRLEEIIRESQIRFQVQTIKLSEDGSESQSSVSLAYAIGILFTMTIYMFIIMYGSMVMQGVSEEKTNRIVEIMVSSVRPFDLMMGKIIGIGLVGLTQLFLWGILTMVGFTVIGLFFGAGADAAVAMQQGGAATAGEMGEWMAKLQSFNFSEILFLFVVYFFGGYLLYASLFAAIGSVIDHPEDAQQFMTPVILILAFALYAGIYSIENPDGPLAFWCSMIPFTSPVVMMMRIPYEIPLWQTLLSVFLLFASAVGLTWISAKIYRIGILIYGKKPNLKEIVRWLSFK